MPKSALIMTCPLCGAIGDHDVSKTFPRIYDLPIFERVVARRHSGQAAGYRVRVRECGRCKVPFRTAEMPKETLDALLHEFSRLRERDRKIDKEFERLRSVIASFDETLGTAVKRRSAKHALRKEKRKRIEAASD